MKKVFTLFFAALLTACAALVTACAYVRPGTVDELKGTYEIVTYTRKFSDADKETRDLIKDNELSCYLVFDGTEYGYVVYRDKEHSLDCRQVAVEYGYDSEDKTKISTLKYQSSLASGAKTWLLDEGSLGFNAGAHKLNHTNLHLTTGLKTEYSDHVEFKRVSKTCDLSYVKKQVNSSLTYVEYWLGYFNGTLRMDDYTQNSPYLYFFLEIDGKGKTATLYYALREDRVEQCERNLPITYTVNRDGAPIVLFTVGGVTYEGFTNHTLMRSFGKIENGDGPELDKLVLYYPYDGDVEEGIREALSAQNE